MKNLFFWLRWQSQYKILYSLLIISSVLLGSFILLGRYLGHEAGIDWLAISDISSMPVAMDHFNKGIVKFNIESNSYLVYQEFVGSDVVLQKWHSYAFFGILFLCYSIYMGAISTLRNNIYYFLASFSMGFFFLLKPEIVQAWGYNSNYFLLVTILIFNGLSYYLVFSKRSLKVFSSILIFLLLSVVYFGFLFFTSQVNEPVIQLINNGIWAPVVITVILIFIVAYDNVHIILYLLTANVNSSSQGTGINFIIVNLLYLANILLVYLKNALIIDWDIIYVDIFVIFITAVFSGIWAFKKRVSYKFSLPFEPNGALVYISIATIGLSTILYEINTVNTPFINFFENIIIYTQLSFGVLFVFYILANFGIFLFRNQKVHLIVYKEGKLPYAMVPGLSLVLCAAFYMRSSMELYDQFIAGYYNSVADASLLADNVLEAEMFYKKAVSYDNKNFKGFYSLGCIARSANDLQKSIHYFEKADILYENNELAIINTAFELNKKQDFFAAIETLKEGRELFPKSGRIINNLGLMYKNTDMNDSTIAMFTASRKLLDNENVALTNLLAFGIERSHGDVNEDMISEIENNSNYKPLEINKLYIYNRLNKPYPHSIKVEENNPQNEDYALYFNSSINHITKSDTNDFSMINNWIKKDSFNLFSDDYKFLKAARYYYSNQKNKGIASLYQLTYNASTFAAMYANTLGLWMLKEDGAGVASDFFRKSLQMNNQGARLNLAIALTEDYDFASAEDEWSILKVSQNKAEYDFSNAIKPVIYCPINVDKSNWTDEMYCHFLHFRNRELSPNEALENLEHIKNQELKTFGALEYMKVLYRENQNANIETVYNKLKQIEKLDPELKSEINRIMVYSYINDNKLAMAQEILNQKILAKNAQVFLEAKLLELNKKNKEAESKYTLAIELNPFKADVNIEAANFYNNKLNNSTKAYTILANAITNNPKSIPLYKAYCIQAIHAGFYKFAEDALESIYKYVPLTEYLEFKNKYDNELNKTLQ